MHLLLLTPHADAPHAADQPALAACRRWLEAGHSIRLLSMPSNGRGPVDRSVHRTPQAVSHPATQLEAMATADSGLWASLRRLGESFAFVSRAVTAQGAHLVVVDRPDGATSLAAWAARFLRGWPVVACVESLENDVSATAGFWSRMSGRLVAWCRRGLLQFSSVVVVPDGRVASDAAALGTPAFRVLRIPEGIRLADWPLVRPRFDYRRLFDSTGRWVLGTAVSPNDPTPGADLVLEAADLAQERSLADVVIWVMADGGRRIEMERSARQRGLRNVRFAAQVPAGSLPDLLASCDGWLHSSLHASPGLLLPSMAMNVPVIVPNGLPDVDRLIDADAGLPMVAGDPESLLDCILELRDHAQACRQGRTFVAAHHDADALTQRTLDVLLQSALPETLPLAAPEPAGIATEPDRTWKDAA